MTKSNASMTTAAMGRGRNRPVEGFLRMAGHDLRNELGGIAFAAGQLLPMTTDDAAGRNVLGAATDIKQGVHRLNRLIDDLLDVVRIETGTLTLDPDDHDVRTATDDVLDALSPTASACGLALEARIVADLTTAPFDRQRIHQVLESLITNALASSCRGGRVVVRAERKRDEIWFSVADTGSGIDPDRLRAIFDPLSQGGSEGAADGRGLKLGLYLAKGIVEAHGGRIWAESTLGRGSTFYFALPARNVTGKAKR